MGVAGRFHRDGGAWTGRAPVQTMAAMDFKKYLPTLPQISRELVAVLVATLGAAYLISKVPAWKQLVRENQLTN